MTINVDAAQGATAPLAERLDRQDAQARQDRWMLELERASLLSGAKKLRGAPPDGAVAAPAAPQPADAGSAAATAGQDAAGGTAAAGAQAGADAVRPGTHAQAAAQPLSPLRMVAARAGAPAVLAAVVPTGAFAPAAVAPSSAAAAAADPTSEAAASRPAGAPLAACGPAAAPLPDHGALAEAGVDMDERTPGGAETPADGAQFDKRLMHLFAGPDGTHAYIRDAELGAAQARSVAAAIGTALAGSGQPLTALTVNGKRISLANNHVPGAALAEPPSTLQPLAFVRKELSK